MKIPWGWELIRNDSDKSFFWIGQELPFRWIAVNWRDGNHFSKEDALEYLQEFPQEHFSSIRYNQDYLNIEFDDFNNESAYSCLLYTSPSPRDVRSSRMPSSA